MNKCNSCKVLIENNLANCPLCGTKTEIVSNKYSHSYPNIKRTYIYDLISHIMLFIAISGSIVSVIINLYARTSLTLSLICIMGVFYLYFSIKAILKKNKNIPVLILAQIALVAIVVFLIDISLGFDRWSINYVIPFCIVAGSIILSVISIFKPKKYSEYIFYIFIIAIIGMIPLAALFSSLATVKWPCMLCVLYSFLTIIFMLMFSTRRFNNEIKKRMHF